MRHLLQRTIRQSISCTGIGLHCGDKIRLTLHPAPVNTGFMFYRTDLPQASGVKACPENVVHTRLATTLGRDGVVIGTVEHLLSALAGLGLDNVRVELSGPEVPIMDGSSAPFVYLLKAAGVCSQNHNKKFIIIRDSIRVGDGDKFVSVEPSREFSVDYDIAYDHPLITRQRMHFQFSDVAFERELSRARTFGFLHEVEYLKKNGFALGGSLANAVVIDDFHILNQDGLRFPDEFVRHKVLDFIGDISLMGAPIIGRFKASRSGHTLNHEMLLKIKATPEAWTLVELNHPDSCAAENIRVPSWGLVEAPTRQAA
jgi:UDP-3-O-[3-hydroxymyristoyl] N-acetylglucosamine deacetylase